MWPFKNKLKLILYMKSGNKIEVNNVDDWEISHRGSKITKLTIRKDNNKNNYPRLIMGSLDLDQIEAITEEQS